MGVRDAVEVWRRGRGAVVDVVDEHPAIISSAAPVRTNVRGLIRGIEPLAAGTGPERVILRR
jgi:hypothetical protein